MLSPIPPHTDQTRSQTFFTSLNFTPLQHAFLKSCTESRKKETPTGSKMRRLISTDVTRDLHPQTAHHFHQLLLERKALFVRRRCSPELSANRDVILEIMSSQLLSTDFWRWVRTGESREALFADSEI